MLWVHKTESMVHNAIAVYVLVHIMYGMFASNMKSCASIDKLDKVGAHHSALGGIPICIRSIDTQIVHSSGSECPLALDISCA